ncbi:MAG: hypothetical protein IPF87_19775 [Gemmatimonadetes bacterium]|nr:hypothetical protein [Gemmatimonadota bacterium]
MLRSMRCDRFDDLVASNALMRPGPLSTPGCTRSTSGASGARSRWCTRSPSWKRSSNPPTASSPQREQVMRISQVLAGISLAKPTSCERRLLGHLVSHGLAQVPLSR